MTEIIKKDKEGYVGFLKAKITYKKQLPFPFLKYKNTLEEEIIPKLGDTWVSTYTTVELIYAYSIPNTYEIVELEGYLTKGHACIANNFVKFLFLKIKNEKNLFLQNIINSLLNLFLNNKESEKTISYLTKDFKIRKKKIKQPNFIHLASFLSAYKRREIHKIMMNDVNKVVALNNECIFTKNPITGRIIKKETISKKLSLGKLLLEPPLKNKLIDNEYIFLAPDNYIGRTSKNLLIKESNLSTWEEFILHLKEEKLIPKDNKELLFQQVLYKLNKVNNILTK